MYVVGEEWWGIICINLIVILENERRYYFDLKGKD